MANRCLLCGKRRAPNRVEAQESGGISAQGHRHHRGDQAHRQWHCSGGCAEGNPMSKTQFKTIVILWAFAFALGFCLIVIPELIDKPDVIAAFA